MTKLDETKTYLEKTIFFAVIFSIGVQISMVASEFRDSETLLIISGILAIIYGSVLLLLHWREYIKAKYEEGYHLSALVAIIHVAGEIIVLSGANYVVS